MACHQPFNLRVYGLLINSRDEILLSDEYRMNMRMCKFPGGGLEYGEGTIDCLKREFYEELGLDIEVQSHFYTTDYFQKALFFDNIQLLSIYYLVKARDWASIETVREAFDLEPVDGAQKFRWVRLQDMDIHDLTFPIDRRVGQMLKQNL